jgi:hypothetical protein
VVLAGWIARKVTGSNIRAYQSALAYGLALPAIIVSCEVRSYMLSVFFVLLSFLCLLEIAGPDAATGEGKPRAGFAAGAILACLSHYFAFFYAGAAIALLLGRLAARSRKGDMASWRAEAATILPVAATIYILYRVHAGQLAQIQSHLLPYYYDPHGRENAASFLLRNWNNFVNLFSPWRISSDGAAFGILILALIGGLLSAVSWWRSSDVTAARALWTLLITSMMLLQFVLAALAGKYPFGGDLRQQYLVFPFLVLCVAILVESMARPLSALVPVYGRRLLNAGVIAVIAGVSLVRFNEYPKVAEDVEADRIAVFDRLEPAPTAVYLDQFNLITFFIYHHTWDWSSVNPRQPIPGIDVYRLRRGPRQMLVFRDKTQWNVEPNDSTVYDKLAECLRAENIAAVSVFGARQTPPKPPFSDVKAVRGTIVKIAADSAVCVERLAVNQVGWYATIRRSNCPPQDVEPFPEILHVKGGLFDDSSAAIEYTGLWSHASFPAAAGGTESYSNDPGSVARLSFHGSEIAYIYTKTFNRGIAEVRLDGIARGEIDLYSPKVVWQARTSFRDLAPGKHTLELIVAGRKSAAAADQYIDLDAFIVH